MCVVIIRSDVQDMCWESTQKYALKMHVSCSGERGLRLFFFFFFFKEHINKNLV